MPNTPTKSIATRRKIPLRDRNVTQPWMFALLLYNTCVAPMSSYCANSIFEYGLDVAKYNVIANVIKFMAKEVINFFLMLADYALTNKKKQKIKSLSNSKSIKYTTRILKFNQLLYQVVSVLKCVNSKKLYGLSEYRHKS